VISIFLFKDTPLTSVRVAVDAPIDIVIILEPSAVIKLLVVIVESTSSC
jgi:hypothetical protein